MNVRRILILCILAVLACAFPAAADMVEESGGEVVDPGPVVVMVERARVVKTADNFVYLFDLSGSLSKEYKDSGQSKLQVLKDVLANINDGIPDLGYNSAMYSVAPKFESKVPFSRFDRAIMGRAIDDLPEAPRGILPPTPLGNSLKDFEEDMDMVSGKTVIFLFTDGRDTGGANPVAMAKRIAKRHDACFMVVSVADSKSGSEVINGIAGVNPCSRVVTFDEVVRDPMICTGELCRVR